MKVKSPMSKQEYHSFDSLAHVANLLRSSLTTLDKLIEQEQNNGHYDLCQDARYFRRKISASLTGDNGLERLIASAEQRQK